MSQELKLALSPKLALVKRRASGFIKHDYLVPGGPYEEQWDWDGFFIGMALTSWIPSEAIYLKNWARNLLEHVQSNGFTPGLITPHGIDKRLKHVKPFLAQGCFFAARALEDFSWIAPHWSKLNKSIRYRETTYFDKKRGLGCWYDSMESGADNNVAALDFPNGSVLAADFNTFLYREYLAGALIARQLKRTNESAVFLKKAEAIRKAMLKYLWDESSAMFWNVERKSGKFIKRVSYSSIIPLWGEIAPTAAGRAMIARYLLNPKKLWAKHGIRTLAADDKQYNNVNMIKPHSNWQGPVWPIANYLAVHALNNYGFKKEATVVAERVARLLVADIKKTGGMHENYHADTGKPLAAPQFISWNLLHRNLLNELATGVNPFRLR